MKIKLLCFIILLLIIPFICYCSFQTMNISGTFNNWDQADDDYSMKLVKPDVYQMTRLWKQGSYRFKFNADKKKGNVVFGAGDAAQSVKENGKDIEITITETGYYQIELQLNNKKYFWKKVAAEQPIPIIKYKEMYALDDIIELNASESIPREKQTIQQYQWKQSPDNPYQVCNCTFKNKPVIRFNLKKSGEYKFSLCVNDGEDSEIMPINILVFDSYLIQSDTAQNSFKMSYQGDDRYTYIMRAVETKNHTFRLIKNNDEIIKNNIPFPLEKDKDYFFSYNADKNIFNCVETNFTGNVLPDPGITSTSEDKKQ